jgi:chaperone modulatory protein CbpM
MSDELIVLVELESASGLTRAEIVELVEVGVFAPQGAGPDDWRFSEDALALAREAASLMAGFDLSPPGLALVLSYRERLAELERRIRELEVLLPR